MPKSSLTRWMGWLDASSAFEEAWHSRLAAYLFMGMTHGWLSRSSKSLSLQALMPKAGETAAEPPKAKTARKDDPLAQARKICQNARHISAHALMEP
eukprot:2288515-Lingulodinium_polyedra.AAC.1